MGGSIRLFSYICCFSDGLVDEGVSFFDNGFVELSMDANALGVF